MLRGGREGLRDTSRGEGVRVTARLGVVLMQARPEWSGGRRDWDGTETR